jgi:hypothetical protein
MHLKVRQPGSIPSRNAKFCTVLPKTIAFLRLWAMPSLSCSDQRHSVLISSKVSVFSGFLRVP